MRRKRSHMTCLAEDEDRVTAGRPQPKNPQPPEAPAPMPPHTDEPPHAKKPPKRHKFDQPMVPPEDEPTPHVEPLERE